MLAEPFILRAIIAGFGVAFITGVLGCFIVWRRMAYFGDSLAHSALLGVAFGLTLGISDSLGIIIIYALFSLLLVWLQQRRIYAMDTLLGILAHASLSFGVIIVSILNQRINIHSYLFGDILTVNNIELLWIYGGGIAVIGILILNWSSFVLMTIHEDLAKAEGVQTFFMQLLFMLLTTIVVAVSIRIVGILLVTSMFIIPAATARLWANSPEKMAIGACITGIIATIAGIFGSILFDIPTGPSIIATAATLFALVSVFATAFKIKL